MRRDGCILRQDGCIWRWHSCILWQDSCILCTLALVFFCPSLMYCILLPLSLYHFIVCMFCKCFSLAFASSIMSVSSLNQALSSICISYHLFKCILCLYFLLLFTYAFLCDSNQWRIVIDYSSQL